MFRRGSAGKTSLEESEIYRWKERAPEYFLQIISEIEPQKRNNNHGVDTANELIARYFTLWTMALVNGHSGGSIPPDLIQESRPLSFLIIGAGSRGNAYATAISENHTINGYVGAIAEPITGKRHSFWRKYVSGRKEPRPGEVFETWQEFVDYELDRRNRKEKSEPVLEGVDGVFVCVLDEMHAEIITTLAPLHLHIMSEKPLATTLQDCLKIYRSLKPPGGEPDRAIFSIGHVLRYSPHNMLLRQLLLEDEVIGDVLSIEHTEPVGYWHFSHSYVR